jgi:tetratricopeptide (TPR) repeat protein
MAPFEGLTLALRPLLAKTPAPALNRFAPVLARIFPELIAWGHARMGTAEFGHDKVRLHDTLVAWLGELASWGPLVWVFDDLQWADPYSLEAFNAVLRAMALPCRGPAAAAAGTALGTGEIRAPILFLGSFRADETPAGSPVWYTVEEGVTSLMKLGAFGPEQVRALVVAMLRDVRLPDAILADLYNATAGNAFFVTEALRELMERNMLAREAGTWAFREGGDLGLSASVEETILRRVANLDEGSRELAKVAAVMGRHPDRAMLLAVSGLDEETLLDRLEILVDRQFILHEGPRLSFPHDRVRAALEETIPADERQALHQRCGEYLEKAKGASTEELAYHFARGADLAKALRYLKQAGDQADFNGAEAVALGYWRQAEEALTKLDVPDKASRLRDLWWDIGFAAFVMYPRVAAEALGKLCDALDADPAAAREQKHGAFTMRAVAQGFAGRPKEGLITVERALALVDGPGSPSEGATLIARTSPLMSAGRIDESIATAKKALAMLQGDLSMEPPGTRAAKVGAIAGLNAVAYQGIQPDPTVRDNALAEAAAQGDPEPFTVFQFFGIWYGWTGREAEAMAYIENTSQKCRRIGAPPYIWVLYLRPYLLWQRGEHAEALQLAQQAQRYPHLAQSDLPNQLLRVLEGHLHLELNDRAAARKAFAAAEARGREAGMNVVLMRALLGKATLAIAEQQWDAGKLALDEVKRLAGGGEARNPLHQALGHRLTGELAIARGRLVEARPPLTAALATFVTPEQDNPIEAAHVHRALGRLAAAEGRKDDALRAYGRAAAIYHQLRNPYHLHAVSLLVEAISPVPGAVPADASAGTRQGSDHPAAGAAAPAAPTARERLEGAANRARSRSIESQYESLQRLLSGVRGHLDDE